MLRICSADNRAVPNGTVGLVSDRDTLRRIVPRLPRRVSTTCSQGSSRAGQRQTKSTSDTEMLRIRSLQQSRYGISRLFCSRLQ